MSLTKTVNFDIGSTFSKGPGSTFSGSGSWSKSTEKNFFAYMAASVHLLYQSRQKITSLETQVNFQAHMFVQTTHIDKVVEL